MKIYKKTTLNLVLFLRKLQGEVLEKDPVPE
jgi:hypothetical protein